MPEDTFSHGAVHMTHFNTVCLFDLQCVKMNINILCLLNDNEAVSSQNVSLGHI